MYIIISSFLLDCEDMFYKSNVKEDGIYQAMPNGRDEFPVYCMFERNAQGVITDKWTVIMNRIDGTTLFQRNWSEFKKGNNILYYDHFTLII